MTVVGRLAFVAFGVTLAVAAAAACSGLDPNPPDPHEDNGDKSTVEPVRKEHPDASQDSP